MRASSTFGFRIFGRMNELPVTVDCRGVTVSIGREPVHDCRVVMTAGDPANLRTQASEGILTGRMDSGCASVRETPPSGSVPHSPTMRQRRMRTCVVFNSSWGGDQGVLVVLWI